MTANLHGAGEADLTVAKHRNGPTAKRSAFQGHCSRFVEMVNTFATPLHNFGAQDK